MNILFKYNNEYNKFNKTILLIILIKGFLNQINLQIKFFENNNN